MRGMGTALTKPSEGVSNDRHDNVQGDYIFRIGEVITGGMPIGGMKPKRYVVEALLGQGSFGQVLRCVCPETHETFAVKCIKNLPAYTKQAALEKRYLEDVCSLFFLLSGDIVLYFAFFLITCGCFFCC
jgi:dual specificity protein kinase YAK1